MPVVIIHKSRYIFNRNAIAFPYKFHLIFALIYSIISYREMFFKHQTHFTEKGSWL